MKRTLRFGIMAVILAAGVINTRSLVSLGLDFYALLFGAIAPIVAVVDYWRDPTNTDRVLVSVMMTLVSMAIVLSTIADG